ncbi:MAG: type I 3-dehydroquinate dehydratase [Spirochaetaceae bacterium]
MICLSLTRDTVSDDLEDVRRNREWIDLVELRVDRLSNPSAEAVARFPAELARAARGTGAGPECILTARRPADGGSWDRSEAERLALLSRAVSEGGFRYVDLELDLSGSVEGRTLAESARRAGTRIIRSFHDLEGMPEDPAALYRELSAGEGEIPKLAVTPRTAADLHVLIELLIDSGPRERIIIGMGPVGFPTRVAAPRLGGYLSYASASLNPDVVAAPGHVTPRMLAETYRSREQSQDTRMFGVIGNPVLHSASPEYHNRHFREKNLDAVYVPFHVDDLRAFFDTAARLDVRGLSVTVPHKEAVISYLDETDESVPAVGACNTVLIRSGRRRGLNTDVPGFLLPLERAIGASGPEAFDGMRATIVGAGGAARAVVFALLRVGVRLCIVNRTPERAERMGAEIADAVGAAQPVVAELGPEAASLIEEHGSLIVQTTSVGMEPEVSADPLAFYEFRGHEIAYELIYAPEQTRFLARAAAAGCLTIPGSRMFEEQALAQAAHFEHII